MKLPHTHEVVVHYAWLDEDGEKMSPEHKTLGSAIKFAADWHENYARIKAFAERLWSEVAGHEIDDDQPWHEREAERIKKKALKADEAILRMSATGKAPCAIVRMVITTTFEEPPSSETTTAQVVFEASELSARTAS